MAVEITPRLQWHLLCRAPTAGKDVDPALPVCGSGCLFELLDLLLNAAPCALPSPAPAAGVRQLAQLLDMGPELEALIAEGHSAFDEAAAAAAAPSSASPRQ